MTQTEIANKIGVTQSYISKYLKGEIGCSLSVAKKFTDHFGGDPLFWMDSTSEQRRAALRNKTKPSTFKFLSKLFSKIN
jgi:plasmid maintenance system antidote protein VapI